MTIQDINKFYSKFKAIGDLGRKIQKNYDPDVHFYAKDNGVFGIYIESPEEGLYSCAMESSTDIEISSTFMVSSLYSKSNDFLEKSKGEIQKVKVVNEQDGNNKLVIESNISKGSFPLRNIMEIDEKDETTPFERIEKIVTSGRKVIEVKKQNPLLYYIKTIDSLPSGSEAMIAYILNDGNLEVKACNGESTVMYKSKINNKEVIETFIEDYTFSVYNHQFFTSLLRGDSSLFFDDLNIKGYIMDDSPDVMHLIVTTGDTKYYFMMGLKDIMREKFESADDMFTDIDETFKTDISIVIDKDTVEQLRKTAESFIKGSGFRTIKLDFKNKVIESPPPGTNAHTINQKITTLSYNIETNEEYDTILSLFAQTVAYLPRNTEIELSILSIDEEKVEDNGPTGVKLAQFRTVFEECEELAFSAAFEESNS